MDRICERPGCHRPHQARGLCGPCYSAARRQGLLDPLPKVPLADRLAAGWKLDTESGCWVWQKAQTAAGYGQIGEGGKVLYTHRVAYELHVGPIPDGLQIDHLCRNTSCCNPGHLEVVTAAENTRRNEAPASVTNRTGVCQYGHLIAGDNVYSPASRDERSCRECKRRRQRESWARTRAIAGVHEDKVG